MEKNIAESFLSCVEILINTGVITKSKGVHLQDDVKKESENTYSKISSYLNQLAKKGEQLYEKQKH